jgi:hypothetical protein
VDYLAALLPSAGLCALFVLLMRAILHADRRERAAATRARTERPVQERATEDESPS